MKFSMRYLGCENEGWRVWHGWSIRSEDDEKDYWRVFNAPPDTPELVRSTAEFLIDVEYAEGVSMDSIDRQACMVQAKRLIESASRPGGQSGREANHSNQ